jgi:large subunit ribosomal protein L25
MIKAASHLAELDLGGKTETVLIRDVQRDHLGKDILHLDFARVSAEEEIETEVNVELRGQAPGVAEGGILEQIVRSMRIKCPAGAIPNSIKVDISHLNVGDGAHVRELMLPSGVTVLAEGDLLIAHVVLRAVAPEPVPETAAAAEPATQPEVIKPERKEKEKAD